MASRKRLAAAVRGFNRGGGMAAVDSYAQGKPHLRKEVFGFAAYVMQHGEPEWFQ